MRPICDHITAAAHPTKGSRGFDGIKYAIIQLAAANNCSRHATLHSPLPNSKETLAHNWNFGHLIIDYDAKESL